MEYWLSEKSFELIWLLPFGVLFMVLIGKALFKSWLSGIMAGLSIPSLIFYMFWVAGIEDDVSVLEFFGVFVILAVFILLMIAFNKVPTPQTGDNKVCEHKDCLEKAIWMVRNHSWGAVSFDHYYCAKHKTEHIDTYKLEPDKDIVRL